MGVSLALKSLAVPEGSSVESKQLFSQDVQAPALSLGFL